VFPLIIALLLFSTAQNQCPPASYQTDIKPWAPGTTVRLSFDATGALGPATNPSPAFTLDANAQTAYLTGMTAWNAYASQNGTNVT
jgi:hypothetical protein